MQDGVIVDDRHAGNGVSIQMEVFGKLTAEAVVDLYNDLIDRGRRVRNISSFQHSSASLITVWLV